MKLHERKITSFPFAPTEHNSKNSGCQARFGRGRPAFSGTPPAGINSREILDADRGKEGCDAVRHDWKLIEADFLATGQSYRALAQKYGAGLSSVKKHAAAGRWQEKLLELRNEELRKRCRDGFRRIFLNDQTAAAGAGTALDSAAGEQVFVRIGRMSARAREIIRVNGDSMLPMFEDGQLVYVEEAARLHPGEVGVFVVNGTGYIKEYQDGRLHSINPAYRDILLSEEDDIRCFGRVLGIAEQEDFPTEEELRILQEPGMQDSGDRQ